MTRLFLDTNIVVNILQRREPFCHDAVQLFTMAYNKKVQLVVSPNDLFHSIISPTKTWS